MGFQTRAGQRAAAAAEPKAGAVQPAPAQQEQPRLERDEALRRLHEVWGPLPEDSLEWARGRLGVNGSPSGR